MVGRDPKVGRGTRIFNVEFYDNIKIQTLEVGLGRVQELKTQSIEI